MVVLAYSPSSPLGRWAAETGGSPELGGGASLLSTVQRRAPAPHKVEGEEPHLALFLMSQALPGVSVPSAHIQACARPVHVRVPSAVFSEQHDVTAVCARHARHAEKCQTCHYTLIHGLRLRAVVSMEDQH